MPALGTARSSAYDALAPFYDAFTAHPNYPSWVRSLETLARSHGLTGRRALDIGCGTGSSVVPLLELRYEVTGCDVSAGMLAQASRRLPADVPLVHADMCALPELGTFDLAWCVNDTVNYLYDDGELRRAFASVASLLAPDGIFVFDVNTVRGFATLFATTKVRETDGLVMAWVGSDDTRPAVGETLDARIEVFELVRDADLWRRSTSRHRQRCHGFGEIREALADAGLRVLGLHGLTADAAIEPAVGDEHTKAIFVVAHNHREGR